MPRLRRYGSLSKELLKKSTEAAKAAVQIFNNPQISFKSELFIVVMIIAWTYLMHSYYKMKNIEYRKFDSVNGIKKLKKTKYGAVMHLSLHECIHHDLSPLDKNIINNLDYLIGIRHEIEHQMTSQIDDILNAKFQACCLNFNDCIKSFFGQSYSIEKDLAISLQFSSFKEDQIRELEQHQDLPKNILSFIDIFENKLSDEEYSDTKYAYRVIFVPKLCNNRNQSDKVITFIPPNSELAKTVNTSYAVINETERIKYKPKDIINIMHKEGFINFKQYNHIQLWKSNDAKNPNKNLGVDLSGTWYWYEKWVNIVRKHCNENSNLYVS